MSFKKTLFFSKGQYKDKGQIAKKPIKQAIFLTMVF